MNDFNRIDTTANRIRAAMDKAGKRQADVVRETGIDKGALSSYLKGRYEPKLDVIGKLAKALNVSEMWLWGYDCSMERTVEHKKNDTISDIVIRLRKDEAFLSIVNAIDDLNEEQLQSVSVFLQYLKNQVKQ